jgi:hypothetical protein
MCGDVLAHESGPIGEQPSLGDRRGPPPLGQQRRQHVAEPLRITLIGTGPGVSTRSGEVRLTDRGSPTLVAARRRSDATHLSRIGERCAGQVATSPRRLIVVVVHRLRWFSTTICG